MQHTTLIIARPLALWFAGVVEAGRFPLRTILLTYRLTAGTLAWNCPARPIGCLRKLLTQVLTLTYLGNSIPCLSGRPETGLSTDEDYASFMVQHIHWTLEVYVNAPNANFPHCGNAVGVKPL
jgi:hypothetical protein